MSGNTNKTQPKQHRRQGGPMGHGPMGGMGIGEKPNDFKGTMGKLIAYMGKYKWVVLSVLIVAAASTVFSIFGPKVLGDATDEMVKGITAKIAGTGNIDFDAIGKILLTVAGLYVISSVLSYIQGFLMSGVTMKVTYQLRRDIDLKLHRLPFSYYDGTTHGEVLSRITNDVDTISQSLNQSITQIISSVAAVIGMLVMMVSISWHLTIVALCVIPASMIFVIAIVKKSQKHFKDQQEYLGHVNGHVEEMYGAHVVVKAFNGEKASSETFHGYNDTLYKSAWKSNFLSGLMMPITMFIGNIGYVVICLLGGYLAVSGSMTVGGIQSFIQYVRQFLMPIGQLAQISNVLQSTAAAAERVFAFLAEEEEIPEPTNPKTLAHDRKKGSGVSFSGVGFGYGPEKTIINNFSAKIEPGQKIAIVGPTGAGKTTIVKLLMRFYDVNKGAVLVNGIDVRELKRGDLRSLFGMVLQDTWLFNGTIADNIKYGKLDATDDEMHSAAVAAQVDHFVRTLPDGYNMVLNEEASNVSQGQKQLLTIARVILADPEVLILDEATSSVDTRTEVLIQKAMDNLMHGRTSFVIAHRLSTIRNADLILVMRDGDIVEQGKHDELLSQNGFYASLYNSQFESAS